MNNLAKRLGAVTILAFSILTIVACGKAKVEPTETDEYYIDDEGVEVMKFKLEKENPVIINYDDDSDKEISNLIANDSLKAKEKYLEKTIKITGEVTKIIDEDNGIIKVVITTPNKLGATYLEFDDSKENKEKLLNLKVYDKNKEIDGDLITVYGYGTRFDNVCLVISHCELA
ncbi:hypothetical protein [uncultured Clostridium sp.]|jgi:hypothetical protein|uniref:hypothetical protein n=1 Tax=uncultured Clostridium sp. TaxID=59620 RepID=UPI00258CADC1|nr:hypothetical protein [uncultured Clostridium sp.]